METKVCTMCKQEKPLSEFFKDPNTRNKSGVRARCKKCYAEYRKDWAKRNKEKLAAYQREWRKKNPGCKRTPMSRKARNANTRFKKLHGGVLRYFSEITLSDLDNLFDGKCYLCGKPITPEECHIEHKIPFSKGGTNSIDNIGFTCSMCNKLKGKLTPDEFLDKLDRILKNYSHLCENYTPIP